MLPAARKKADGYKHPPAFEDLRVYSFPSAGGDAVSGGAHSPVPIAKALGNAGRSRLLLIILYHYINKCRTDVKRKYAAREQFHPQIGGKVVAGPCRPGFHREDGGDREMMIGLRPSDRRHRVRPLDCCKLWRNVLHRNVAKFIWKECK